MKKIALTETVLRDANQSMMATRMKTIDFEEILPTMDEVGYGAVECWGGATFDSCLRYLDEDPWERLRTVRKKMPRTRLSMLLRGRNLVGYRAYSEETVRRFVAKAVGEGIDVIRIFDAMNDADNIRVAVEETAKRGGHPSCALSYTVSPLHTVDYFVRVAKEYIECGAQSICIKDMSGILSPTKAKELIVRLKRLSVPVYLHSHCTAGLGFMSYLAALQEGVDGLDTAISAFSGGTSQPSTESVEAVAREYGLETGCNLDALREVSRFFKELYREYDKKGKTVREATRPDADIIRCQIPGGMYSNLITQLKEENRLYLLDKVEEEIPNVRADLGYPPLVTPVSQMVGVQAVINAVGKRYEKVTEEVRKYLGGSYGKILGEVKKELLPFAKKEENFPDIAETDGRYPDATEGEKLARCLFPDAAERFFSPTRPPRQVRKADFPKRNELPEIHPSKTKQKHGEIYAFLPCKVVTVLVKNGDTVTAGQVLGTVESMKMISEIVADRDGTVTNLKMKEGEFFLSGSLLLTVEGQG